MNLITCIEHFISIVNEGGFAKAARKNHISVASISKHINYLEQWCKAQLLHRTTRSVQLTAIGEKFYKEGKDILVKTALLRELPTLNSTTCLQGTLRLNIPSTFNENLLLEPIFQFMQQHPHIRINMVARPHIEELIDNTTDVIIALKKEHSVDIKAHPLFEIQRGLYAAPSYLETSPSLTNLHDLNYHNCLLFNGYPGSFWHFADGKKIQVHGNLTADHFNILIQAAVAGMGILYIAEHFIEKEIQKGELVRILSTVNTIKAEMFVYYLRYRANPLIESFIRHLLKYFKDHPKNELLKND